MKKLLILAATAAGIAAAYRRMQADQAEARLWAEATAQEPPDLR